MAGGGTRRDEARERFWRGHVEGQVQSGESVRAYCRTHRLQETTFYDWRRELARREAARFVPVTVAAQTAEPGHAREDLGRGRIEILVGNGRRVQVTGPVDRQALADVLAVVEGRGC